MLYARCLHLFVFFYYFSHTYCFLLLMVNKVVYIIDNPTALDRCFVTFFSEKETV